MKIGYIKDYYPEQRCIIDKVGGVKYVFCNERLAKTRIKHKLRRLIHRHLKVGWDWLVYDPLKRPNVDILHTFNSVCAADVPWVVTFESTIPRTNQTVGRLWERDSEEDVLPDRFTLRSLELLLSHNCVAAIAISESALRIQKNMLEHIRVQDIDISLLRDKLCVIHPPQKCMIDSYFLHKKYESICTCINFLFVGRDFFRKGGVQLVEALRKYEDQRSFHLTIISDLGYRDFASIEEMKYWETVLPLIPWVTWIRTLSNHEVIELCKKSHIGCLPTLQDTYGYSILEMQACGCPVITTNVRACPEINNELCGWIVPLKIDHIGGEAIRYTDIDKENRKKELLDGLDKCISNIFDHPAMIMRKAEQSLERIAKEHDPNVYAEKLKYLYRRVL